MSGIWKPDVKHVETRCQGRISRRAMRRPVPQTATAKSNVMPCSSVNVGSTSLSKILGHSPNDVSITNPNHVSVTTCLRSGMDSVSTGHCIPDG
eukprot:3769802-Rhodomonas_salina.2